MARRVAVACVAAVTAWFTTACSLPSDSGVNATDAAPDGDASTGAEAGNTGGAAAAGTGGKGGAGTGGHSAGGVAGSGSGGAEEPEAGAGGSGGSDAGTPVVGRVFMGSRPAPGASVFVNGVAYVGDVQGKFTVPDPGASYDALVVDAVDGATYVTVFVGLTTRSPFFFVSPLPSLRRAATVSGSLSGGGAFPNTASQRAGAGCAAGGVLLGTSLLGAGAGPDFGPIDVSWFFGNSLDLTLFGLRWTVDAQGLATDYSGFAAQTLTLADGADGIANLEFQAPETRLVAGAIDLPSDLTVTRKILRVGGVQGLEPVRDLTGARAYQFLVPSLGGLVDATLHVFAEGPGGGTHTTARLLDGVTSLDLALLAPPVQVAPVGGATGVGPGTAFTFTAPPDVTYSVSYVDEAGTLFVDVITTETTVTLPDLTAAGLSFEPSTAYSWTVAALGPMTRVDDHVRPALPLDMYDAVANSATNARTFVTPAP